MKVDPKYVANIAMHVILISTLLTIFFFTYATRVEEQIVKDQVNYIISDFTENVDMLPIEYVTVLKSSTAFIKPPDMTKIDKLVTDANSKLMNNVLILIIVFVIFGLWLIYSMSKKYNFDFYDLMKHNMIVLIFVGLTEFVFLTYIGKSYRSGDSNSVKKSLLTIIKEYGNSEISGLTSADKNKLEEEVKKSSINSMSMLQNVCEISKKPIPTNLNFSSFFNAQNKNKITNYANQTLALTEETENDYIE